MKLIDCFTQDFTEWLCESNHPDIISLRKLKDKLAGVYFCQHTSLPILFGGKYLIIEEKALSDILNTIIDEPSANHFWYSYPESGSKFYFSLPSDDVVPADSLTVDKEKIKSFLRDMKIDKLLS